MRVLALLIIAGMLAGCQTAPRPLPPDELNRIQTRTFNEPFDRVFSAVLETLRDANYPIAVSDPQSGLIMTDDVLPEGHPIAETEAAVRSKWSVMVTRTGDNRTTVRARWFYAIRGAILLRFREADQPESEAAHYKPFFEKLESKLKNNP